MSSRDFAYWLMGFFEITNPASITEDQTKMIKNHLNLVFKHEIDPSFSSDPNVQQELNAIHLGKPPASPWNGNQADFSNFVPFRC